MANHLALIRFSLALCVCFAPCAAAQDVPATDRDRATFVIGGKVQKVDNLQGTEVVTVQVSTSLRTPPAIGSLENEEVRVIAKSGSAPLILGNAYTFYAVGASGSNKLTVREIARINGLPANIQFTALQPSIAARYQNADVVVRAEISKQIDQPTLTTGADKELEPPSEHDPKYQTWTLKVADVLKGNLQSNTMNVLVATNPDIAYAGTGETPTPTTPGETRVIALRWDSRVNSFVATDQIDVRPLSELPAIQETVKPSQVSKHKN